MRAWCVQEPAVGKKKGSRFRQRQKHKKKKTRYGKQDSSSGMGIKRSSEL